MLASLYIRIDFKIKGKKNKKKTSKRDKGNYNVCTMVVMAYSRGEF